MKKLRLIMSAIFMALTSLTTYGQSVGDQFEIDGITYEITAEINFAIATNPTFYLPGQVKVVSYNPSFGTGTEVTIPSKVNDQSIDYNDYWVTEIDNNAFEAKGLTGVDIPYTMTKIGNNAFLNNQLTEVVIPFRVNSIGASAFQGNPLETVIARSFNRPNLANENAFGPISDRIQINLLVPADRFEHYSNNGWGGFKPANPGPDPDPGTFTADGFTYAITAISQPEVEIVDYDNSSGTEVTIPQTVDHNGTEYKVTAIGYRAFNGNGIANTDKLTSVNFAHPSNVTRIGEDAFWRNKLTGHIEIPESVTSLGQRSFGENKEMIGVTLPSGITRIERWTFAQNDLRKVTISANVKHIDFQAFAFNDELSIVSVQHNPPVTTLHATAFNNQANNRITFDLVVPPGAIQDYENSVWTDYAESITYGVANVNGIKYGIIGASLNEATVIYGSNLNPRILAEVDVEGLGSPRRVRVTAIGDNAFDTRDIQTIVIPETVKSIGARAFYSQFIFRVTVNAAEPPELHDDAFHPLRRAFIDLFVPQDKAGDYIAAGWTGFKSASSLVGRLHLSGGWLWEVTSVNPNKVRLIDHPGLRQAPTGSHLEIPSEIEYLPNSENDIMYTVTSIGDGALKNLNSRHGDVVADLASVVIPASVDSIRNSAFSDNKLPRVDIPDGVTYIGDSAFAQNQLTRVDIPGSVESIGNNAFENNNLTTVEIPNSVTSIGEYAFTDNQLTRVTTPANVRTIDRWVYSQNQLTEVTISGNVEVIDLFAFEDNPNLHLVTVEADDPPVLHEHAFSNADRDQIDLVVPQVLNMDKIAEYLANGWDGFRSISYGIFTVDNITYGITSRTEVMVVDYTGTDTEVTIPETADNGRFPYAVTAIREDAFQNKELTNIKIPSSVTSIGQRAFSDNQLTAVAIPGSMQSIGFHAFFNNPDLGLVTAGVNTPTLDATAFTNANRDQIDLLVPIGKRQEYLDNGWHGFRSVKEGIGVSIEAPAETINLSPFTVTFQFDLEVTGFTIDDIDLSNATANHFTGSGSIYTVEVTPASCNGVITIDVPANTADIPDFTNLQATATVTVEEDPNYLAAIARDIIVQLDADGRATILPEDLDNGSAYGCSGTPELSLDRDAFTCDDVGTPVTVTLTADHGTESATTTATVTVEEYLGNLTANAKDIIVQLDVDGQASISPGQIDDGSVYGCGNTPELSLDRDAFTCDDVGTPVTVTLTANQGTESATATATVTVEEYLGNLVAIAKDITVQLDADGQVTISPEDVDNGSAYGCSGSTPELSLDIATFDCSNVGTPITVTLTANQGTESTTATATVTVEGTGSCPPMIPTAFTPNGDGANDLWIIDNLSDGASVRIYDRNGTIIFSSGNGYTRPWDGTFRSRRLPTGGYIYRIQDGPNKYTGTVTILL